MRTNYNIVLKRKASINNGSAHAHNIFYSFSYVQDFYKKGFIACAQISLKFSCAKILYKQFYSCAENIFEFSSARLL